jgi:hypothetical protein
LLFWQFVVYGIADYYSKIFGGNNDYCRLLSTLGKNDKRELLLRIPKVPVKTHITNENNVHAIVHVSQTIVL